MTDETTPAASASPPEAPPPPPPAASAPPPPAAQPTNGLAIAALVLGILAICGFWIPFLGWIPAILGVVLGAVALQQPQGRGMAIAGIVCSAVAILVKVWFWLVIVHFLLQIHHHHWTDWG